MRPHPEEPALAGVSKDEVKNALMSVPRCGSGDLNRKHRRALGTLLTRLFELFGKKLPADPVEIATGFIALGPGKDGETNRSGRIVVPFLKALIGSAPSGA